MNIIIRDEREADIPAITDVTAATFLHAEHASHTEQFVVTALRNAGVLTVSKVAESYGKVIGHVAVSPVEISDGSERWFGLGPISVLPEYQKQGVGSKLMHAALDALRQKNAQGCVLLGDPNYYHRFGFAADSRLVLPDVPPEYFQALLMAGDFPVGVVTYHDGFNAVS
ncbi:MAG: N-acetyltransferase [Pseudomonadales bacterium]